MGALAIAFPDRIPERGLRLRTETQWRAPVFAGLELCPLIRSIKTSEAYFVALPISGIALAVPNMAWAIGIGIVVDMFISHFPPISVMISRLTFPGAEGYANSALFQK